MQGPRLVLVGHDYMHLLCFLIQSLTAEDSELRQRMNSAMSEMGGMASKLTDALKERDALKVEVGEKLTDFKLNVYLV